MKPILTHDERRAYILINWRKRSDEEMADFLGMREPTVARTRQALKLYRKPPPPPGTVKTPPPVVPGAGRGYTREQIAWAKEHAQPHRPGATGIDQEAGLMLVHHADRGKVER